MPLACLRCCLWVDEPVPLELTQPSSLYPVKRERLDQGKLSALIQDGKLAPCFRGAEEACGPAGPMHETHIVVVRKLLAKKKVDCSKLRELLQEYECCPICFLHYPVLNSSRCCSKRVCTECYLQVQMVSASVPTCPFCKVPGYSAKFIGLRPAQEKEEETLEEQRLAEARLRERQEEMARDLERERQREQQRAAAPPPPAVSASAAAAPAGGTAGSRTDASDALHHTRPQPAVEAVSAAGAAAVAAAARQQRPVRHTTSQSHPASHSPVQVGSPRAGSGPGPGMPAHLAARFPLSDFVPTDVRSIALDVEEMNNMMLEQALFESMAASKHSTAAVPGAATAESPLARHTLDEHEHHHLQQQHLPRPQRPQTDSNNSSFTSAHHPSTHVPSSRHHHARFLAATLRPDSPVLTQSGPASSTTATSTDAYQHVLEETEQQQLERALQLSLVDFKPHSPRASTSGGARGSAGGSNRPEPAAACHAGSAEVQGTVPGSAGQQQLGQVADVSGVETDGDEEVELTSSRGGARNDAGGAAGGADVRAGQHQATAEEVQAAVSSTPDAADETATPSAIITATGSPAAVNTASPLKAVQDASVQGSSTPPHSGTPQLIKSGVPGAAGVKPSHLSSSLNSVPGILVATDTALPQDTACDVGLDAVTSPASMASSQSNSTQLHMGSSQGRDRAEAELVTPADLFSSADGDGVATAAAAGVGAAGAKGAGGVMEGGLGKEGLISQLPPALVEALQGQRQVDAAQVAAAQAAQPVRLEMVLVTLDTTPASAAAAAAAAAAVSALKHAGVGGQQVVAVQVDAGAVQGSPSSATAAAEAVQCAARDVEVVGSGTAPGMLVIVNPDGSLCTSLPSPDPATATNPANSSRRVQGGGDTLGREEAGEQLGEVDQGDSWSYGDYDLPAQGAGAELQEEAVLVQGYGDAGLPDTAEEEARQYEEQARSRWRQSAGAEDGDEVMVRQARTCDAELQAQCASADAHLRSLYATRQ